MRQKKIGNKKNGWKWAFLLLLALNAALVAVVVSRVIQVRENIPESSTQNVNEGVKVGTFSTNIEQLNAAVTAYLADYQTDNTSYAFYATSTEIMFEGSYTLLGYEVPLYIYFQPVRLESGAVQLTVTSFSAGTLSLPEKQILQYLQSSYDLPDFVEVLPDKSAININIQNLDNAAGIYLKASEIDLVNDQIIFEIYKK
ncbi:YpmS family protein [Streptococcus sp. H49]|uniref:YpmS family protein n=1 Tax=Streptococcus huangxiaojuni TaxID=3237239 RepID=UPI0034A53624